jgi:hypothetical protein
LQSSSLPEVLSEKLESSSWFSYHGATLYVTEPEENWLGRKLG